MYDYNLIEKFDFKFDVTCYSFCRLPNNTLLIGTNSKNILKLIAGVNSFENKVKIDLSIKIKDMI